MKLFESDFGLLHLRLILLAVFRLGPPFAHSKNWARLAKLGEDKIGLLVEGLELLGQSSAQRERLNFELEEEHIGRSLNKLSKVGDSADDLLQLGLRAQSDALVGSINVVAGAFASFD